MGHMAKSVCAKALAIGGELKTHNSNGTICAVLGERVYMTCANGKDRINELGCGKFEVVNKYTAITSGDCQGKSVTNCFGTNSVTRYRKDCVHWVLLTKEMWDSFTGT